jgi:hypothetical protein
LPLEVRAVINLANLIHDAQCFQTVRDLRWPDGVTCPHHDSRDVVKDGKAETLARHRR